MWLLVAKLLAGATLRPPPHPLPYSAGVAVPAAAAVPKDEAALCYVSLVLYAVVPYAIAHAAWQCTLEHEHEGVRQGNAEWPHGSGVLCLHKEGPMQDEKSEHRQGNACETTAAAILVDVVGFKLST